MTDGGKKLSLTGKLKLSDHYDQGMTDFYLSVYLWLCAYIQIHSHVYTCIYLLKSGEKIKQSHEKTKLTFWGYNLSVLAEVLTCHQKFKLKLSDSV